MEWMNTHLINENTHSIIYIMKSINTGHYYIGRCQLFKMVGKIKSKSNWVNYYGSSIEFKEFVKKEGRDTIQRKILCVCDDKINTTYKEIEMMIKYDWLNPLCFNKSILGKIYKKNIKN